MTCELCDKQTGALDFGRNCCRVRFLLAEPRRMVRQAWLIRWTTEYGRNAAKETEAAVLAQWQERAKGSGDRPGTESESGTSMPI